jgi:tetratricopeptide (TPR) repeat protein
MRRRGCTEHARLRTLRDTLTADPLARWEEFARLAEAYAPHILGIVALERGDYAQAEALIRQALQTALQNSWPALVAICHVTLSELQLECWFQTREPALLQEAVAALNASEEPRLKKGPVSSTLTWRWLRA